MSEISKHNIINYIEFFATDIAATKKFYTSVFGWEFVDYGPEYTCFQKAGLDGGFALGEVKSGHGPLPVIHVDDLQAAYAKVKAAGGKIVKEIFSFPGGSRFHFADPSGNELAVWHME
ncbi:MAG: VOC family protein [Acidobacteriota bacterium]|nr:VOC family protein [Acidobacteriota bacterium]